MSEQREEQEKQAVDQENMDRRGLLKNIALASSAGILPILPSAGSAQNSCVTIGACYEPKVVTTAAGYSYQTYASNYAVTYFCGDIIDKTVQYIKSQFNIPANAPVDDKQRKKITWGNYQKYAGPMAGKPDGWGSSPQSLTMFRNWESAVKHARDDLKKTPVPNSQESFNPNDSTKKAKNLIEHLDEAVRIALFDKAMPNKPWPQNSGVEICIEVNTQSPNNRRHHVETKWRKVASPADDRHDVDQLKITMYCPFGGWLGWATLEFPEAAGKLTELRAKWLVPSQQAFSNENQILFIFCGAESVPVIGGRVPGILQPVLQWTKPAHPSKSGWRVRSWYVPATYTPSISQFPPPDCAKLPTDTQLSASCTSVSGNLPQITDPDQQPYWTLATAVEPGDTLTGIIKLTGTRYKCYFEHLPKGAPSGTIPSELAVLELDNIPDLTYVAAVVEGYKVGATSGLDYIQKNKLPKVTMVNISVKGEVPNFKWPDWDYGESGATDTQGGPVYGTNRIRSYSITKAATAPGTFGWVFTPKKPGDHS